jgi:hypothetical protein
MGIISDAWHPSRMTRLIAAELAVGTLIGGTIAVAVLPLTRTPVARCPDARPTFSAR